MLNLNFIAFPKNVRLDASTACQLRCPSCSTANGVIAKRLGTGHLKLEFFKRFIDDNPQIHSVELSNWGEIFLNPQLCEIMQYAHEKNVALSADNGANLNTVTDRALEGLVQYRFRRLNCSIDGASQATYSQYRVRGDWNQVIENIKKINQYKKKYASDFPQLTWQFVVFGHNQHELPTARALAAELGMAFKVKLSWDDKFSPVVKSEQLLKEMGLSAASRSELRKQTGKPYSHHDICEQLWTQPQINFDGKVLGCCVNVWGTFGNVSSRGFVRAINSWKMIWARLMLMGWAPSSPRIPCTQCRYYKEMARERIWFSPPKSDLSAISGIIRLVWAGATRYFQLLKRSFVWNSLLSRRLQ